jgi:hypothetical protein
MSDLVDFLRPQTPGKAEAETILVGKLVKQMAKDWIKVDNQASLWGPIFGAASLDNGTEVVVAIDQNNRLYVIYPGGSSTPGPPGPAGPAGPGGGLSFKQLVGDGVSKDFTITHNLGTRDVQVTAYRTAAPYDEQVIDVEHSSASVVTVHTLAPPEVNGLTIVCSGPGAAGGAGAGGDLTYVHNQGSPSASWAVAHNLGKYPAVDVVDTGGSVIIPSVIYVDANNVTLSFGSPTSGKAYAN